MQVAASKASSASSLRTGRLWASGAEPAGTETNPPAWMMRSKADLSTTRSFTTGKGAALHGSMVTVAPSSK
ncbi:hypothetical protein GCM10020219_045280 [Nonomuraea dietziae]